MFVQKVYPREEYAFSVVDFRRQIVQRHGIQQPQLGRIGFAVVVGNEVAIFAATLTFDVNAKNVGNVVDMTQKSTLGKFHSTITFLSLPRLVYLRKRHPSPPAYETYQPYIIVYQ